MAKNSFVFGIQQSGSPTGGSDVKP